MSRENGTCDRLAQRVNLNVTLTWLLGFPILNWVRMAPLKFRQSWKAHSDRCARNQRICFDYRYDVLLIVEFWILWISKCTYTVLRTKNVSKDFWLPPWWDSFPVCFSQVLFVDTLVLSLLCLQYSSYCRSRRGKCKHHRYRQSTSAFCSETNLTTATTTQEKQNGCLPMVSSER